MPTLLIKTNVSSLDAAAQQALMLACSRAISALTGKPESFVMVSFESVPMVFGGTPDPCAFAYLASLGALGPAVNPDIVKAVSGILEESAGVPPSRTYVQFCDVVNRGDYGWNGSCFG